MTETFEGDFQANSVTRIELVAQGIRIEAIGAFQMDTATGNVYGVLESASAHYVSTDAVIANLSGAATYFDLYNDPTPSFADAESLAGNDTYVVLDGDVIQEKEGGGEDTVKSGVESFPGDERRVPGPDRRRRRERDRQRPG